MGRITYDQARSDFEFLEGISILSDQVELDAEREPLMQNPTKAKATEMYCAGIRLWFGEHRHLIEDLDVYEIAERHGEAP